MALIIEQRRGFAVEGEHAIDAVACDADGTLLAHFGSDRVTTFRSAAKPFQLEASLGLLPAPTRAALTPQDLALGAASHHGEPVHIDQVESLLPRLGRSVTHLYCGAHAPAHAASAQALWARGGQPSALHNNCSGKHSFMAAASAANGYPEDYRDPRHPLQEHILAVVQERTGHTVQGVVTDGCGVPCFVLPLSGMARAWASLARALSPRQPPSVLGDIGRAMREHPLLMSGSDAFDGWLTQRTSGIAKVGAQGLLCLALPEQGVGLAIKARSGGDAVRPAATLAVLERVFPGFVPAPIPERFVSVYNVVGARVGEHAAIWT